MQFSIQPQLISPKLQAPFGDGPGGIERIRPGEEVRGEPAQTLGRQPRAGAEADLRDHNK